MKRPIPKKKVGIVRIQMVKEDRSLYGMRRFQDAAAATEMARVLFSMADREIFLVVSLDSKLEPMAAREMVRLLRADEIECRIATINERRLSLLLFKDARVDQKILDETFTPSGWRRSHQSIDGNLYCTVEIDKKFQEIS